ncbi:MAG TPA: NAD(P)H-dependent oxidoreductase [Dictyoglomaceae bacterium]|nr:NAD(P)H-dependent oxidoreductase [Dictyoglomaceae bacterium]
MSKVLVLYDSVTGNTKQMAYEVAEGVKMVAGIEVVIKHVDEAKPEDLLECDGIIVGSPTYCGTLTWKLKKFFDESIDVAWGKVKGKIGAAFSTSGGLGGGNEATLYSILTILLNYGYLVFGLPDYSAPGVTAHYGTVSVGAPKEAEKKAARLLGIHMGEYVKKMCR